MAESWKKETLMKITELFHKKNFFPEYSINFFS